jgi:GDP-L-fucose synthase
MEIDSKILITGSEGMVGKNLILELIKQGYKNLIFLDKKEVDLMNREEVFDFFKKFNPEYVFHNAARVGGIKENLEKPVEYLRDNLLININVIDACFQFKIKKLIVLNSATIYPENKEHPSERDFFSGELEKENEAYGLSKICSVKLCEYYNREYDTNFINVASTNIYGEFSKFEEGKSNIIPSLIKRFNDAKIRKNPNVVVWGSGNAIREVIYVGDLVKLLILVANKINKEDTFKGLINCGLGNEVTIKEIANIIKKVVKFKGEIFFDITKPEGIKKRTINSNLFKEKIGKEFDEITSLENGIRRCYKYFKKRGI